MRVIGLVAPVPLLLIQGEADTTVPLEDARRLAAAGGATAALWTVAGADHSRSHATAPQDYERRVTDHLRMAFRAARDHDLRDRERDL
jgi:fermentation-respiration switch protein FrsA (DUF1100 family)